MVDLPTMHKYLSVAILVCSAIHTAAQTPTESFALRLQGGINLALHSADFSGNGDIIDCGLLSTGSGLNGIVQGVLEFPVTSNINVGLGIGYVGRSATLSRENTYPIRDGVTGQEGTLITKLEVQPSLSYLEIQPDFRMPIVGTSQNKTLGLIIGPRISLPITTRFHQHETVVSPLNATFNTNGTRTQDRTIASGPLTTRSGVLVGGSVGLESFFPLSKTLAIVPVLSADYFVSSIVNDAAWHTFGVRLEAGLRFSFYKAKEKPPVPIVPPPPPPAVIVTPVSVEITQPSFTGEIVTGNKLHATTPIVNAVFFDSTSAVIPSNYLQVNDGTGMSADAVTAHNWIMPRIASVLKRNPGSSVTLEGSGGTKLGTTRAEAVRQVLVTLGVSPSIITVVGRDLPRIASNPDFEDGRIENNRVDILVNRAPLQEWVTTEQFAQLRGTVQATVTRVGGAPELANAGSINVRVTNFEGSQANVNGRSGEVSIPIADELRGGKDTVQLYVEAESFGAVSQIRLPVSLRSLPHRSIELETKSFEAVLRFDYNSAQLSPDVQQLLTQLVAKLPKESAISVAGSADALGSAERNKKLSDERAQRTVEFIQSMSGTSHKVSIVTTTEHFSDSTPQGRFLNRSIRISVTTP